MKKIIAILLPLFANFTTAIAQHTHHPCGYEKAVQYLNEQFPGYGQAVNATFEGARRRAVENAASSNRQDAYVIPVVVHVVWKEPAENIPDSQIEDQIDVLNESYRRLNSDTTETREIFKPVAGDAYIEFVLADIKRVQTNANFSPTLLNPVIDQVKQAATGGSTAVDPEHFLNIWVCQIGPISIGGINFGQIIGYAYPPADLANWPAGAAAPSLELEGVVMDYRAFGRGLTYDMQGIILPIEGRSTVHEVGHYLGLRHIWGDGLSALLGIPDCSVSDGIDDTPTQGIGSQFQCDHNQNTCTDSGTDLPDMVENYMDYSRETCQNMFTHGQIAHMHAVLEGPRRKLWEQPSQTQALPPGKAAKFWPNPASSTLFIETPDGGMFTARLLNAFGTLLETQNFYGKGRLELGDRPAGIYYIQLLGENGEDVVVEKVVKR